MPLPSPYRLGIRCLDLPPGADGTHFSHGFRLPPLTGFESMKGAALRAAQSILSPSIPAYCLSWATVAAAQNSESPELTSFGVRRSAVSAYLMHGFLCLSLWLSFLLALWLTRGWLGLLLSGQVLSSCAYLAKRLARGARL
jgi:hypothetical protein